MLPLMRRASPGPALLRHRDARGHLLGAAAAHRRRERPRGVRRVLQGAAVILKPKRPRPAKPLSHGPGEQRKATISSHLLPGAARLGSRTSGRGQSANGKRVGTATALLVPPGSATAAADHLRFPVPCNAVRGRALPGAQALDGCRRRIRRDSPAAGRVLSPSNGAQVENGTCKRGG
jgi:hypothetical protein